LNISPRIKKDLRQYYVAKKYEGEVFSKARINHMFQVKYDFAIRKYCTIKHVNNKTFYEIKKISLVENRHALQFFDCNPEGFLWQIGEFHITGTNLYIIDNNKIQEYENDSRWLLTDIEERHINKRIKNYHLVLRYLKLMKQSCDIAT